MRCLHCHAEVATGRLYCDRRCEMRGDQRRGAGVVLGEPLTVHELRRGLTRLGERVLGARLRPG